MPTMRPHTFCSYCGTRFPENLDWPRICASCGNTTYRNPLPVAVVLVPVESGLLLIRRSVEPRSGKLALPGGYINFGENWQEAAAREVKEEAGLILAPTSIQEFRVCSAPDGTILIFGVSAPAEQSAVVVFEPTDETSECVVVDAPVPDMAFPLHAEAITAYFERRVASGLEGTSM